jgi:hypothetical protein
VKLIPASAFYPQRTSRKRPVADIRRQCDVDLMRGISAITLMAVCGGCSTVTALPAQPAAEVPVQIFTGGDDGLTHRLVDAIRSEFTRSARFTLASSDGPDALVVTIPTHVDWKEVGGKTQVTYQLQLQRAGRDLGKSSGECWDDELTVCAQKVLRAATVAVAHNAR